MKYKDIIFEEGTTFLVTGGAGFIGSNLCETILNMGYNVRCLDNFSTGKRENIAYFKNNPMFELMEGDIRNYETCLNACKNVDFVLHQAALGSVPESIEKSLDYEEVNVKGTVNMMEAAKKQHVKKFVFASSAAVYGDDETLPKIEEKIGNPLSPYALTKRVNEYYGRLYTNLYGLDTYGLRYFNVYGKRQDPNGSYASVIPKFVKQLLDSEQPVIYGDGMQSRDFVYVEDVVRANLWACKASHEVAGQVYNVASGEVKSLLDIYGCLCKVLDKDIAPIFDEERDGDIKYSWANIGKATGLLGYEPQWSFTQSIEEVVEWYEKRGIE
jgi:UDP-N-acetylglucosamine 4-epimerase